MVKQVQDLECFKVKQVKDFEWLKDLESLNETKTLAGQGDV